MVAVLVMTELAMLAHNGRSPWLTGQMLAFDLRDQTPAHHQLVRQPQCPACGDPEISLRPAVADSRTVPTDQACARLAHRISPYLGVVTWLTPVEDYSNGVTLCFVAGHNLALSREAYCWYPASFGDPWRESVRHFQADALGCELSALDLTAPTWTWQS